jgi:hypothetical protein
MLCPFRSLLSHKSDKARVDEPLVSNVRRSHILVLPAQSWGEFPRSILSNGLRYKFRRTGLRPHRCNPRRGKAREAKHCVGGSFIRRSPCAVGPFRRPCKGSRNWAGGISPSLWQFRSLHKLVYQNRPMVCIMKCLSLLPPEQCPQHRHSGAQRLLWT